MEEELAEENFNESIASTSAGVDSDLALFHYVWNDALKHKDVSSIDQLIVDLINTFALPHGLSQSAAAQYCRILSKHGVVLRTIKDKTLYFSRDVKYIPSVESRDRHNLSLFLRQISNVTRGLCIMNYIAKRLNFAALGPSLHNASFAKNLSHSRLSYWNAFSNGDYRTIELLLSSNECLRIYMNTKIDHRGRQVRIREYRIRHMLFSRMPHATYMAVQAVISNFKTPLGFLGEQLLQLTYAHFLQMSQLKFESGILVHINEILLCAMAFGNVKVQEEISGFELESQKARFLVPSTAWKIVSRYERAASTVSVHSFYIDATRLIDTFTDDDIGIKATVFVEVACDIMLKMGTHFEQIAETITSFARHYPSTAPRMARLAEDCDVSFEVDSIVDNACSQKENALHPSEPMWLDWVERRMKNLGRFGAIETTMTRCVHALFEFLDFASNKNSNKAWELLHDAIQKAVPEMVHSAWLPRSDWWPKFHSQRMLRSMKEKLTEETLKMKEEVMNSLMGINVNRIRL